VFDRDHAIGVETDDEADTGGAVHDSWGHAGAHQRLTPTPADPKCAGPAGDLAAPVVAFEYESERVAGDGTPLGLLEGMRVKASSNDGSLVVVTTAVPIRGRGKTGACRRVRRRLLAPATRSGARLDKTGD